MSIAYTEDILSTPIEFLKGVGPQRGELLRKELNIHSFGDLLEHYPYRHIDRTRIQTIGELTPLTDYAQVTGVINSVNTIGGKGSRRLVAELKDKTGVIELIWFQGISWIERMLEIGRQCIVFGKISFYNGEAQMAHPEVEFINQQEINPKSYLEPIYPTTEKLKSRSLGGRQIAKLTAVLFNQVKENDIPENIPQNILKKLKLAGRYEAFYNIHFPGSPQDYNEALRRLKFEEFFIAQLRLNLVRANRHRFSKGVVFDKVGDLFNQFYKNHLPFALTNAQKRVIKEIRQDTATGSQMNRLLQGDVGSGKTIVALLLMLIAADNGYQGCLMAPTEILARQHFETLSRLLKEMTVPISLLTGSTKATQRKKILNDLKTGELKILVGTHAVIEDVVQFEKLGLVVIDEQHRFGVAQRARLWKKSEVPPHILVMTATPIPRTLAMTAYGDLDYSVIDELPPGRQPVTTVHRNESHRNKVMDFIRAEIDKGRQVYIIFPLIEESAKLDFENLMKGYENVKAYFPEPKYWISMVHGRQPADQKQVNMKRFIEHDTQIMVSTTVIEVGVDVPNASVMVIESAEKFGLSQLHQLRGRVGRGAEKSYCILLTGSKLGADAKERMKIMVQTSNGFEIAEKDLQLRGPGDIEGTRQSGELNFKLANIVQDRAVLETARNISADLLVKDPDLSSAENLRLKNFLGKGKERITWGKIS